jgi:hypothetical protein
LLPWFMRINALYIYTCTCTPTHIYTCSDWWWILQTHVSHWLLTVTFFSFVFIRWKRLDASVKPGSGFHARRKPKNRRGTQRVLKKTGTTTGATRGVYGALVKKIERSKQAYALGVCFSTSTI